MIYQVSDGTRSINRETETTSTIFCNTTSILQQNSSFESRKSSAYSSSARSGSGLGGCTTDLNDSHEDKQSERKMTNDIIIANRRMTSANINQYKKKCRSHRMYEANGVCSETGSTKSTASTFGSTCSASSCSGSETSSTSGEPNLPYPGFPEYSMRYLAQDTRPRNWCLLLITNPWFERVSILVILFNCITLGMYQPCVDDECVTNRCKILQVRQHRFCVISFSFFIFFLIVIIYVLVRVSNDTTINYDYYYSFVADFRRYYFCIFLIRNEYQNGCDGRLWKEYLFG